jgi:hypothetical protein
MQHILQSGGNIDNVYGAETFLHPVRCDDIAETSQSVEQAVLVSKHGCWSYDGSFRVDVPGYLLALSFGAIELCRVVGVGVVGRDVDVSVDIILRDSLHNALCALNVNVIELKVPGLDD